eukprot:6232752-Amphidinium_carterae.1
MEVAMEAEVCSSLVRSYSLFVSRQKHPEGVQLEPADKYVGKEATRVFRGGQAAAERARARVGEAGYCLLGNNCEHFCSE